MSELRFMLKHIERKSNEIIFRKCNNPNCRHCLNHPIVSKKSWEYLHSKNFKWPNPTESESFPGHYKTYLEVDEIDEEFLTTGLSHYFFIEVL